MKERVAKSSNKFFTFADMYPQKNFMLCWYYTKRQGFDTKKLKNLTRLLKVVMKSSQNGHLIFFVSDPNSQFLNNSLFWAASLTSENLFIHF